VFTGGHAVIPQLLRTPGEFCYIPIPFRVKVAAEGNLRRGHGGSLDENFGGIVRVNHLGGNRKRKEVDPKSTSCAGVVYPTGEETF
jgi:hypothetical protein